MGPGQNQQSVVHPFIFRGRHQMTYLWHFVVQKIITTAIEVCIWLFMCPGLKLHSFWVRVFVNVMPTFTFTRPSAVSHGPCDLCHHRSFCVIFVSDLSPSSPFGLLNPIVNPFSYITAATDLQTIDTIAPQNCQIENNLFWWPVDKMCGWSAALLHQHKYSSNPRVHSIENQSQTVYI